MTEAPEAPAENTDTSDFVDYGNYWGSDEQVKHFLPDGKQYFVIQVMNEGAKSRFQKMTSQNLVVNRQGDATVKMDAARERHELIMNSVVDWNMMQLTPGADPRKASSWSRQPFSKKNLEQWLEVAPPKIVEDLEYAIRVANPWLQADMTVEEIDKEIDRLNELRAQAKEREAGETASANK